MHLNGGKLLKCHLKGKASRKLANGQNIDYSEKKENLPRASSAPALGLNTIIFKHVYWYMQQISGEHLQDHWSSGCSIVWWLKQTLHAVTQKMMERLHVLEEVNAEILVCRNSRVNQGPATCLDLD